MLLLALVLAVTAGGGAASVVSRPLDPCGVVTKAEAAAVVGTIGAPPMSEPPGPDEDTGAQRGW